MPPFYKCSLSFYGFSDEERKHMEELTIENGTYGLNDCCFILATCSWCMNIIHEHYFFFKWSFLTYKIFKNANYYLLSDTKDIFMNFKTNFYIVFCKNVCGGGKQKIGNSIEKSINISEYCG